MKRLKQFNAAMLFFVFLVPYVLLFFYALLFKNISPLQLFSTTREYIATYNLIPFSTVGGFLTKGNMLIAASNILGNIVLFVPLGIYLQLFERTKKITVSVTVIFLTTLLIEVLQFVFGLGTADIDDVILNLLGGAIGVLIYRLFYTLFKTEDKVRFAIVVSGLLAVIIPLVILKTSGLMLRLI